jgi:hypothetical protein
MALLSAALFGAATPTSKMLLGSLTAFQLAGLLYLGAVLGVLVIIIKRRSWRPPWENVGKKTDGNLGYRNNCRWHSRSGFAFIGSKIGIGGDGFIMAESGTRRDRRTGTVVFFMIIWANSAGWE